MAENKIAFSSWRMDTIELEPNGVTDFPFFDTKPNLIYLKNPNNTRLYISMKNIPTKDSYEFEVKEHSYDAFGQPNGTGHLYIYNPLPYKILIDCYSVRDEFNIAILKNYSVAMENMSVEGEFSFKAGESLPAGANEIGAFRLNDSQLTTLKNSIDAVKSQGSTQNTKLTNLMNNLGGSSTATIYQKLQEIVLGLSNVQVDVGSITIPETDLTGVLAKIQSCIDGITDMNTNLQGVTAIYQQTNTKLDGISEKLYEILEKELSCLMKTIEISGTGSTNFNIGTSGEFSTAISVINDGESDINLKFFNAGETEIGNLIIRQGETFEGIHLTGATAGQITAVTSGNAYKCRLIGR